MMDVQSFGVGVWIWLALWSLLPYFSLGLNSLYLPFSTSVAYLESFEGLSKTRNFTLEFWIASTTAPQDTAYVLSTKNFAISFADTTTFLVNQNPANTNGISIPFRISSDWHHIAVTYGTDTGYSFYVDATKLFGNSSIPRALFYQNKTSLIIGKNFGETASMLNASEGWEGFIDELRVWNLSRSQLQISSTMNFAGIPTSDQIGLVAVWSFEESNIYSQLAFSSIGNYTLNLTSTKALLNQQTCSTTRDYPYRSSYIPTTLQQLPFPSSFSVLYDPLSTLTVTLCPSNSGSCAIDLTGSLYLVPPLPSSGQISFNGVNVASANSLPLRIFRSSILEYSSALTAFDQDQIFFQFQEASTSAIVNSVMWLQPIKHPSPGSLLVITEENTPVTITLGVSSLDGNLVKVFIGIVPATGSLYQVQRTGVQGDRITSNNTQVSNPGGAVIYVPTPNTIGSAYSSFTYYFFEAQHIEVTLRANSSVTTSNNVAEVTIRVQPQIYPPTLNSNLNATTWENSSLPILVNASDANSVPVSMLVASLPEDGILELEGKPLHTLWPAVEEVTQYVSSIIDYSSHYSGYDVTNIIGPPTKLTYGDCTCSWAASTYDGNCQTLGTDYFYTEFIHIGFETAVYVTEVHILINFSPGALTRILAPFPDRSGWFPLWFDTPKAVTGSQFTILAPQICHSPYKVQDLRLEFDTCTTPGWIEINAIRIIGTTDTAQGQAVLPANLLYTPTNRSFGPAQVNFSFTITECLGLSVRASSPIPYQINVSRAPASVPILPTAVQQGITFSLDILGKEYDLSLPLEAVILSLPTSGTLYNVLFATLAVGDHIRLSPLSSKLTVDGKYEVTHTARIYYFPIVSSLDPLCGNEFADQFQYTLVSGGNLYSVEIQTVQFTKLVCTYCPAPFWLSGSVCRLCPSGTTLQLVGDSLIGATCGINSNKLSETAVYLLSILLSVGVVGILIVIAIFFWRVVRKLRFMTRNLAEVLRSAPSGEVTMVITDIEGSSSLHSRNADTMRKALEVHNDVILTSIRSCHGYEAENAGDSYFVTFKNPKDALAFATKVQLDLLKADWPSELLNYEECKPSSGALTDLGLNQRSNICWRGLRVRMGIHIGTPKRHVNYQRKLQEKRTVDK